MSGGGVGGIGVFGIVGHGRWEKRRKGAKDVNCHASPPPDPRGGGRFWNRGKVEAFSRAIQLWTSALIRGSKNTSNFTS